MEQKSQSKFPKITNFFSSQVKTKNTNQTDVTEELHVENAGSKTTTYSGIAMCRIFGKMRMYLTHSMTKNLLQDLFVFSALHIILKI